MVNTLVDQTESKPRKRRSSHQKGSKEAVERRRRLKSLGTWLALMVLGAALVALIAVFAGGGFN
jgi:hypothetical protein